MKYDFTSQPDRSRQGSNKWMQMQKVIGNEEGIVPLSVADMEFKIPPQIRDGLKEYLDQTVLGYTRGNEEYYHAVISWLKRRHDFDVEKSWIVETPGIVPAIFAAINEFTKKGDGVIVMPPVYYPFFEAIKLQDREIVECPLIKEEKYRIDFDLLEELTRDPKNKTLLFCSPHNPVARVWEKEELEKIAEIAIKNDVFVLCDEIHFDFVMPGYKHTVFQTLDERLKERTITFTAPSKSFNLAGMMLSNIVISDEENKKRFIESMDRMSISTCTALGYKACEIAYNECEDWFDELIQVIDENQKLIHNFFKENHPSIKADLLEGTYLSWVDFRSLEMTDEELEEFCEKKCKLFLDQGYIFGTGGSGFARFNLAAPKKTIEEALERLDIELKKIGK